MMFVRRILLIAALAAAGVTAARGATTPNSYVTPQTPNRGIVQFLQGTDVAGTYKTLYTAGANGSRCYGMWSTNNDGSATHLITVQVVNGGVKYGGTALTSVLSAGFANATPSQNVLATTQWVGLPIDQYGNPYLQLVSGDTVQATFATALTAAAVLNVVATCVDF